MPYKHGIYARISESKTVQPDTVDRGACFVGTSPVNLASDPKVNEFVKLEDIEDAQKYIGYTDDFENFTLNEVVSIFLNNPVQPVGPIYVCNVLDPEKHKGTTEQKKEEQLSFYKNVAYITDPAADINSLVVKDRKRNEHYLASVVDGKIQIKLLPDPYKAGSTGKIKQEAKLRPQADDTNWPELYAAAGITFENGVVDFKPDAEWTHDPKLEIDAGQYKMIVVGLQFPKPDPDVKKVKVVFPGAEAEGNTGAEYDLSQEGVVMGDGVENGEVVFSFSVGFYDDKTHAYFMNQEIEFTWIKEDGSEIQTSYTVEFAPEEKIDGNGVLKCWYDTVDPSKVTVDDIIGTSDETGVVTGLQAIANIEETCNVIPTDLAIPGYSSDPKVFKAMQDINPVAGHWLVYSYADLDVDEIKTMDQAILALDNKEMRSETASVFWPKEIDVDGKVRHASVGYLAQQLSVDLANGGIPYQAASNVETHLAGKYFGENAVMKSFSQDKANSLNEAGINTICWHNGSQKYWGTHTSAYKYGEDVDPRAVDLSVMRMLLFLVNGFQQRYGDRIDQPMSRSAIDEILVSEKQYLDMLVATGALLGNPQITFEESKNPMSEILQGHFVYDIDATPATPLRHILCDIHYTDEGVYTAFTTTEE